MDKFAIRKEMSQRRLAMEESTYQELSDLIFTKVINDEQFQKAHHLGLYVSFRNEVDTRKIIQYCLENGKRVSVPRVLGETMEFFEIDSVAQLESGFATILEPTTAQMTEKNAMDIIYVPMLAYDKTLNRIGYGKGFYDKYLKGYSNLTIGLAFSFQEIDYIETNNFDFPLDFIYNEL